MSATVLTGQRPDPPDHRGPATTSATPACKRTIELDTYLQLLAGGRVDERLIEIRYVTDRGMGRLFIAARRVDIAARRIASLATRTDVYCGALLRARRAGGRDAVADAQLAWVEIDRPDALARLADFPHPPTMVITSGSPGHAHAYWQLDRPVQIAELEHANRKLAHRLGGDLASVDAARILRPCGTLNHKRQPPRPVSLAAHHPARRYPLAELVHALEDPPAPRSRAALGGAPARGRVTELDEALLAIPASSYVRVLAGLEPSRDGKVNCPFHDDAHPSLQLYDHGTFYCFGCGAGGRIYDFAARLWFTGQSSGVKLRGRRFIEVRDRLSPIFLADQSPGGGG